jgi:energy-coupling factor transport system ATP-binding protein
MAAILAARPGVVALDEPTRGMDPARKAVLATLLRAMAADGAAVLIATHDAAFARQAGDRSLVMHDGAPAPVPAAIPAAAA